MLERWWPVAALLSLVLLSGWVWNRLDSGQRAAAERARHIPDYFVEDFTTTTMGETGRPTRRLTAKYMAHFLDTQTKELERPYMMLFSETEPPWHIKADTGWVSAPNDVILLYGRVKIWRNDEDGRREVYIVTKDVKILPDSDYAETEQLAVIRMPGSESRGVGLRAFMAERRLELLSQVRTIYDKKLH